MFSFTVFGQYIIVSRDEVPAFPRERRDMAWHKRLFVVCVLVLSFYVDSHLSTIVFRRVEFLDCYGNDFFLLGDT